MKISGYSWAFILLSVVGIHWAIKKGKAIARKKRLEAAGGDPSLNPDFEFPQDLPPLRWLEGDDSPTGRKVLDCRSYALGFQFVTTDAETEAMFEQMCASDGSELEGRTPDESWLVAVDWNYEFEESDMIAGGLRAQTTEDLWVIDCRDSKLYFRRSWTGQLVFMANFRHVPSVGATITRLWVAGDEPFGQCSPEYIAAYVHHLIDTHLLGVLTPFPIPPDLPKDDKQIASFVFHSVGRRGWLAEHFGDKLTAD